MLRSPPDPAPSAQPVVAELWRAQSAVRRRKRATRLRRDQRAWSACASHANTPRRSAWRRPRWGSLRSAGHSVAGYWQMNCVTWPSDPVPKQHRLGCRQQMSPQHTGSMVHGSDTQWRFEQNWSPGHGQSTGHVPQSSAPGAHEPSPQTGTHCRFEQTKPPAHGQSPGHVPQSSTPGVHEPSPHTASTLWLVAVMESCCAQFNIMSGRIKRNSASGVLIFFSLRRIARGHATI